MELTVKDPNSEDKHILCSNDFKIAHKFTTTELIKYLDNIQELVESEYGYEFQNKESQMLYKEIKHRLMEI